MPTHKKKVSFIRAFCSFVPSSISSLSLKRKPGDGGVNTTTTTGLLAWREGVYVTYPFSSTFTFARGLFVDALPMDQILCQSLDVDNFGVGHSGWHTQPPAQSLYDTQPSTAVATAAIAATAATAALQYTNSQTRARVPLSRLDACSSLISIYLDLFIHTTTHRQLHNHESIIHPNSSPSRPSTPLPR